MISLLLAAFPSFMAFFTNLCQLFIHSFDGRMTVKLSDCGKFVRGTDDEK